MTTPFGNLSSFGQREAVTAAERRGGGPQALAMVMLIGKEPVNFGTAVWACETPSFYWGSAQRAALAYCLTHNIPLDYPTSAGAIAPHPTPAD